MTQPEAIMDEQHSSGGPGSKAPLLQFLGYNPSVQFVRFCFMDLASIVRVIVVPKASALEIADCGFYSSPASPHVAMLTASNAPMWDHVRPGLDDIIPDWDSLKACPFYPSHAMVMCAIREPMVSASTETNLPGGNGNGNGDGDGDMGTTVNDGGFELCPRTVLSKQVARAAAAGQELLIGLELELFLIAPETDLNRRAFSSKTFDNTTSLHGNYAPVMDEIVLAIVDAGIKVMKYHHEGGSVEGMFEIVLAPFSPVQAADALLFCREAIKTVSKKHGLEATLMPTPLENKRYPLGLHTNLSISDPSDGKGKQFLAGVLDSLVAISAFAMSSVESGARAQRWKGWVTWGKLNKACVVNEKREGFWEIRCGDATMNPYLTFAAIIAAGMTGIESKKELRVKPMDGLDLLTRTLTDAEREHFNVEHKISDSLEVLVGALKGDKVLQSAQSGFSGRLVKLYSAIKMREIEDGSAMSVLERKEMLRHLF
ncbi:unnamed protein product [Discula destructiva]